MIIKLIISVLGLLNGGWMIFDGLHVLIMGKYFGPTVPGPWSKLVSSLGVDPFSMGVPFIVLGLFWFIGIYGILIVTSWGWFFAIAVSIASLWYFPVGTIISVIHLVLILRYKAKLGYG